MVPGCRDSTWLAPLAGSRHLLGSPGIASVLSRQQNHSTVWHPWGQGRVGVGWSSPGHSLHLQGCKQLRLCRDKPHTDPGSGAPGLHPSGLSALDRSVRVSLSCWAVTVGGQGRGPPSPQSVHVVGAPYVLRLVVGDSGMTTTGAVPA